MKTELKNLLHSSHTVALSKDTIFAKKCWFFVKKMLTSAKLREPWYWKVYFLKLHMCVSFLTEFQVSTIILTSFRICTPLFCFDHKFVLRACLLYSTCLYLCFRCSFYCFLVSFKLNSMQICYMFLFCSILLLPYFFSSISCCHFSFILIYSMCFNFVRPLVFLIGEGFSRPRTWK